jgi:predicted MPP superfamily phosphohydrolase
MRLFGRDDPRWVRLSLLWLLGVTGGLVVVGIYAGQWFPRPRLAIVGFILLMMWPFAHARLWLMRHLDRVLPVAAVVGILCACVAAVFDAVMITQLLTARANSDLLWIGGDAVSWIGPVWFSSHAMIFFAIGLAGPVRRATAWLRGAPRRRHETSLERRSFLRGMGQAGVGLPFAISLSGVETSYSFRVEEREITLANWPARLDGLRVAHLSDIHVGGAMDREKLTRVAALTNAANVDLVLHTGDFLTHRLPGFDEPLYDALATVKPRYGQWACLGNHDYDDPNRLVGKLGGCGVEVLRDRLTVVEARGERIEIGGLDFGYYGAGREGRHAAAMERWTPRSETPRILLCHDPTAFAQLPDRCADLVLSGHTHGGHVGVQISSDAALTVVGLLGIPDQGVFERPGMMMYVTRCVGFYGYPIRLGIPPEIAVLTLRSRRA